MKFVEIYLEFKEWLNGLVEDDPIPYEINSFSFFVNSNLEIGFSASEETKIKKIDLGFYFPLESEYFYSKNLIKYINLNKKTSNLNEKLLKILYNLLIFYNNEKDNIFKNKKVYFGNLFKKANLLI